MGQRVRLVVSEGREPRWRRLQAEWQRMRQQYGEKGVMWLTATVEQAEQWRWQLEAAADQVQPLQAFADELVRRGEPGKRWLDEGERCWAAWRVVERCAGRLGYFKRVCRKRGFAVRLARTLAELEAAGLDASAWEACLQALEGEGGPVWRDLELLYREWEQYLNCQGWLSEWQRQRLAADLWHRGQRPPFASLRAVLVTGYIELPRSVALLLGALADSDVEVWGEAPLHREEDGECSRGWSVLSGEQVQVEKEAAGEGGPRRQVVIEAAGPLGEARCVLRQVRQWLDEGVPPQRIVLACRDLAGPLADRYLETAADYRVPLRLTTREPLIRQPIVAFLLLALRVAVNRWPLRETAALLRHSCFQPDWPELQQDPQVKYAAELLLRQLGVPQGRRPLQRLLDYWLHRQDDATEESPDNSGETEHARSSLHELTVRCYNFWQRLFRHYESLGLDSETSEHDRDEQHTQVETTAAEDAVAAWRSFITGLGIRPERLTKEERTALERLERALVETWQQGEARGPRSWLHAVEEAAQRLEQRLDENASGVLLVEAEEAAGLACDYLLLVGMGEGSWPRSGQETLLTEDQRLRLHAAGLPLYTAASCRSADRRLFFDLTHASVQVLVFSYPAYDANGQTLLPAVPLQEWREGLGREDYEVVRQRMLLDGYGGPLALGAGEQRVQFARALARGEAVGRQQYPAVTEELARALTRAQRMAAARFRHSRFTPFEGWLEQAVAVQAVRRRFHDRYLFSPTALETYLECPFRFFVRYVLDVQEIANPADEMEHTRRGLVLHEALARFHQELHSASQRGAVGLEGVDCAEQRWVQRLEALIDEAIQRHLPRESGRLAQEVWRWEGIRLRRYARRYWRQWQQWLARHRETGVVPEPVAFEETVDAAERLRPESEAGSAVRLGGRIDRVDRAADEGVWIIDYKTGRGYSYTAAAVERLERLQLPAYAWAWEQRQQQAHGAAVAVRGLVYWFVMGKGPQVVWPGGRGRQHYGGGDTVAWTQFRQRLLNQMHRVVAAIRQGWFPLAPRERDCTVGCPFATICRISQRPRNKEGRWALSLLEAERPLRESA